MQDDGKLSLHNHLRFTILYHRDVESDLSRIVGFEVKPFSVQHKYDGTWNLDKPDLSTCNPGSMKYVSDKDEPQEVKEGKDVIFTYDVVYEVRLAEAVSLAHLALPNRQADSQTEKHQHMQQQTCTHWNGIKRKVAVWVCISLDGQVCHLHADSDCASCSQAKSDGPPAGTPTC